MIMDTKLDRKTRKKVERILSSYRNLEAIIKTLELEEPIPKMTVSYDAKESQGSNQFHSETERIALYKSKIEHHKKTKSKLDIIYNSLKPMQQKIWEERYILGKYDTAVIFELNVSERTYYRTKGEMLIVVAEAFCLV